MNKSILVSALLNLAPHITQAASKRPFLLKEKMPTALVTLNSHDAVTLLNAIELPWEFQGAKFFNDYAILHLFIDGQSTEHRMRLNRDGTWSFQAEVSLES